jgi:glutamine synthetase
MTDFEPLCLGKGPQFAVHSISFVPELTPADSDQGYVARFRMLFIFVHGIKLQQLFLQIFIGKINHIMFVQDKL